MNSIRLLLTGIIVICSFTIGVAQNKPAKQPDDPAAEIEQYRQLFWDSLPQPVSWTNDYAWLFSTAQRNQLNSIIADFEKQATVEICIVTLDTFCVSKENFDALALHIAKIWGIGKKDKNNGIMICISPGYQKIRIENGYGIENYLSDQETKEIIDTAFLPQYKKGNFFAGTTEGLNAIISKLIQRKIH